ncbi:hypothetical protein [Sneathiella chinensis]|nr:hypothetical protein [Sneathiella chinensis]
MKKKAAIADCSENQPYLIFRVSVVWAVGSGLTRMKDESGR